MKKLKNILEIAQTIASIAFVLLCMILSFILIVGILRIGPEVFRLL